MTLKHRIAFFLEDLHAFLFPKKQKQIIHLVTDNQEMMDIAVQQIKHIQELEDKIARLDFDLEDSELSVEQLQREVNELESRVDGLEYDVEHAESVQYSFERENDSLQDQVDQLENEVQSLESQIDDLNSQLEDQRNLF